MSKFFTLTLILFLYIYIHLHEASVNICQMVAVKAAVVKEHSNDDEKCRCNGLRMIVMVWETFDGSVLEMHIMIRKIVIRHVDKHNQPRRQTIYKINQRLSVALQHGVEEQLIACECAG